MTRLNLAATLELLDRQTPSTSELLSYATKPHGDAAEPPLPSRGDAALEVFQQWAESVSRWGQQGVGELAAVSNWPLEAIAMGADPASGVTDAAAGAVAPAAVQPASWVETDAMATGPAGRGESSAESDALPGSSFGAKHPRRLPQVDNPFDPAIFNRRFRNLR